MDTTQKIQEIRNLLAEGNLQEAIDAFMRFSLLHQHDNLSDYALLISSRFTRLRNEQIKGTITDEAYNVEHDKCTQAISEKLKDVEKEFSVSKMTTPHKKRDYSGDRNNSEEVDIPMGRIWFAGIGINDYEYWPVLNNAVRDMEAVAELLQKEYGVEVTCMLRNREATRSSILNLFDQLTKEVEAPDSLILYYSGHGHLDEYTRRGFLVPANADEKGTADYIRNSTLKDYFQDARAQHLLFISDACFSGSLLVERKGRNADEKGFAELAARPSRWVMCSGRHNEAVSDGPRGGHSPFAQALLDELRFNRKPILNIAALANEVQLACKHEYKDQLADYGQIADAGDKRGQLIFRRKIDESALRQQDAQTAWPDIQALPEEDLKQLRAKRQRISAFCDEYPDTKPYDDALRMGRDLELKDEFLSNWHSELGLRDFILKNTPYRDEAKNRLEELCPPAPEPTAKPAPTSKAKPAATPRAKLVSPKPKSPSPAVPLPRYVLLSGFALMILVLLILGVRQCKTSDPDTKIIASIAANMVHVEGGTFTMGCKEGRDANCHDSEKPPRQVQVSSFSIGKYEVTQAQWRAVMAKEPSGVRYMNCNGCPVEGVSWNDVEAFIIKLNSLTGQSYRLPTEAEWEFAARGGNRSHGFLYSGSNDLEEVAYHINNASFDIENTPCPVGSMKPNELGLYDMSGNVWEWVQDCWHENYYNAPSDGKAWLVANGGNCDRRSLRGGSWFFSAELCRSSARSPYLPMGWLENSGFRLALD